MYGHLYNKLWANRQFDDHAKEYKYRTIVLRDGVKVLDKIESLWSLSSELAPKLIKSWNCNYSSVGLEYIYCPI